MSHSSSPKPAGGKTQHPLPRAQRPQVVVDDQNLQRWKQDAMDDVEAVLMDTQSWFYRFDAYMQQHKYKVLYDKPKVRGGGRVHPPDSQIVEFLCRVELNLTLEDVVLSMHNESSLEQRLSYAQIYQDIVLDGALIELLEGATDQDPFHCVSVKWLAFDSPARKILRYRDYLYFEICFTTQDATGRRVLVDFRKSMDLSPEQLVDHGLDIVRSEIFMLTMYYMEGDKLISFVRGVNEPFGSVPSWVSMNYLTLVFARLLNLQGMSHSKVLLRAGVRASSLTKRQSNSAPECHVCRRKFTITRRKAWCRACGRTVCRHCTSKLILPVDGNSIASVLPFVRARFCHGCIVFAYSQTTKISPMLEANSFRLTDVSEISVVSTDSFFGDDFNRISASSVTSSSMFSVRSDSVDSGAPPLSASRLERMLGRLSFDARNSHNRPRAESTTSGSESPRSTKLPIYPDDGLRRFFPSANPNKRSGSPTARTLNSPESSGGGFV